MEKPSNSIVPTYNKWKFIPHKPTFIAKNTAAGKLFASDSRASRETFPNTP
jgi:hypothetical protein